ncbi:MAG: valine--tRNA ligase [Phycisphaerae bacterium]
MSSGGYDPHAIEAGVYQFWEQAGGFRAMPDGQRQPYVVMMPPPNVTGALHLGHAMFVLQDVLVRYYRMRGRNALYMPGIDHAGIATQAVVEKQLREKENKTRHEIGREGLVRRIWEWKEQYGGRILEQLRRIGVSADWDRTRFTLDEPCAKAVYETFYRLFDDGLIFRGPRLVNWDAQLQTAVADDEIVHETVKGHLWRLRYPLLNGRSEGTSGPSGAERANGIEGRCGDGGDGRARACRDRSYELPALTPAEIERALRRAAAPDARVGVDYLVVATTRPETLLGDTAVAVHPDDERYRSLIGSYCLLPLMHRPIPIIGDDILVKREFGTGCVKVTPGHDPNDYACGQRQKLPLINILTLDGKINANGRSAGAELGIANREPVAAAATGAGGDAPRRIDPTDAVRHGFDYVGLPKEKARKQVVADFEALGLLDGVEDYVTEIGHSDRSKTPIEPMISEQWFVRMAALAEPALEAVRDGRVQFHPARYADTYLDWLGEKRDWCISRQLWWGHRIPVWARSLPGAGAAAVIERLGGEALPLASIRVTSADGAATRVTADSASGGAELPAELSGASSVRLEICLRDDPERVADASLRAFQRRIESDGFERDPDVLDTWFSSSLWPFSTLGWPHQPATANGEPSAVAADVRRPPATPAGAAARSRSPVAGSGFPSRRDYEYFFPTDVLCTGRGIITLWVVRMVATSLYLTGRVPFRHVYINPTIQDGQGRTMSKSLGNGVDPLDIIELYGTDALRFTMTQLATETQDIRMPVKPAKLPDGRTANTSEKFELGRNFCNKLWQAATGFILPNLEAGSGNGVEGGRTNAPQPGRGTMQPAPRALAPDDLTFEDHWILSRLSATIADVDRRVARYQFGEVVAAVYGFFWNDLCDWYIELAKPRLYSHELDASGRPAPATDAAADTARQVLAWLLDQTLRLLHPVTPFITEELWRRLNAIAPRRGVTQIVAAEDALITAHWPDASAWARETRVEREVAALQDAIRALRDIRTSVNTTRAAAKQPALRTLPTAFVRADAGLAPFLLSRTPMIQRLGQVDALQVSSNQPKPPDSLSKVLPGMEVYVPAAGLVDLELERRRLQKELAELAAHADRIENKLANQDFVARAPAAVVEQERAKLVEARERLGLIETNLRDVGG